MLLGVDVGGTFTDAVLVGDGLLVTAKAPSTPQDQSLGVMAAIHAALAQAGVQPHAVTTFAHGMTVATNALLEGRAARTALVVTEGFTDVIELGRQARAELYRLCASGPAPLVGRELRFAAPERMTPEGPLRALDAAAARALAEQVAAAQPDAVAVVLLHAYRHPQHERALAAALAAALPHAHVSLSHEVVGTFREYERAATTEIDAALSPLLGRYLRQLAGRARAAGLPEPAIMQSNGGLIDVASAARHASWTVLSGPAGGAAGAAFAARASGVERALCLDMGGTSCDVCIVHDGAVAESGVGTTIAGRPIALPLVDVHTVGAGGGSIAWRDAGGALRVGPRSAGAQPGPACYGRGGSEPTVTDAHVLLGSLAPDAPLAGDVALDRGAAERAVGALAAALGLEPIACAEGIVRVADAEMAQALRHVTVERGIDPRTHALLAFGGAGPLHAVAIAEALGIDHVIVPRASGVLAALGLVVAPRRRDAQRSVLRSGAELTAEAVARDVAELAAQARAALGAPQAAIAVTYELRYRGQAFELEIAAAPDATPAQLRAAFEQAHEQRYGYRDATQQVELVTVRVSATLPGADVAADVGEAASGAATAAPASAPGWRHARIAGHDCEAAVWRGALEPGLTLAGPAICELPQSTLLVPDGWAGAVTHGGAIELRRAVAPERDERPPGGTATDAGARRSHRSGGPLDPVELQVVLGALHATCEEMGAVLIRAAHSANIKERHDASTALFDADGELVMQAEHIPVHLGAMPAAVAAVRDEQHLPGRAWVLNDPFAGGTHLPDITVVTPVFTGAELIGFAANRAHHADVGGPTPGSMPSDSRTLADEGVVIAPQPLDEAAIARLAAGMRQPAQRRADLRAQLAANRAGAARLATLAQRTGTATLRAAMAEVLAYAERRMRACIAALPDGVHHARDVLEGVDGDLELMLRATVAGERLVLDFEGSVGQHDGNLNCPLAVTRSACYFAVRVLTDPDIPPSAGAYRPIEVRAPEGSLLNARRPAAVAAGNVETSSRVADLVLAAFGHALGQGTMNNLTLGNDDFTYYETLGGGQGACADSDGPSGVHVAMSNTRNTPVEALELEFPLRVGSYALRRGSGGSGRQRGGDGVVRELEALAPMTYSLLTERRRHAPPGADGGEPGARGRNLLDGRELDSKASGILTAGQRLRLETPGGGGRG